MIARQIRLALGNGLAKALTWSRTQTMRAYRGASLATYQANANLVKGWTWNSARNTRTCAICWAMDGTEHELSEPLDDHPNGRCFAVPVVKTWEELGISGMHPARPPRMTGSEAFARLSEAEKLEVLGPAKYAAYKDGAIMLEDLVGRKWDARWGSMRYERSLKEIMGKEEASYWIAKSREMGLGMLSPSLGAAVNPYAELQIERLNQLINMGTDDLNALITKMRAGGNLPKLKYHYSKHGFEVSAVSEKDYQGKMNEFLRQGNIQYYSVVQRNHYKIWYSRL